MTTDTDVAGRAAAAFADRDGGSPDGLWAAPGRVNLIGEHTDYNEGFVLPFALPERVVVAAARADAGWTACSDFTDETVSFGDPEAAKPGAVTGWGAYVAGVVWALQEAGLAVPSARLALASDVPVGAGLSSSHALECAVLTALADLGDLDLPLADRPKLVQ